ncbi:GHKL domain-containing protein [Thiothrix fructosivorans]|uniref:histidine kinase n=2 Tax=Thiothrix fructosivorans TaxID=111770 RepID=A0A8B0SNI6_9GAMM|nr:GHKL domain-containing protein [Thiothrix fructosivorans]QTX11598.1 GHKL domain-containing protein [Thiothrix fructosivorans]
MINVQHLAFLHRLANIMALSVMLVGGIVLFGWGNHLPALYRVNDNLPMMTPVAAFSFIFTGAALFLVQPAKLSALRRLAAQVLAFGGIALGILMLLSYWHPLPDQWLGRGLVSLQVFNLSPEKDSLQTAVAFILTCTGLFLLSLQRPILISVAQWSAFISLMLLVTVFFGFAHQEDMFAVFTHERGMALPTATAFALVGWGIILAKVENGFFSIMAHDASSGLVVRWVMFLMAWFPPLLGWLPVLLVSDWLTHTRVESLLASVMVVAIVLTIIHLAYRLEREERLRTQAQEEAEQHQTELSRMVNLNTMGEMASGIAHELNQPLAAVANYASACQRLLSAGEDAQRLSEPLRAIQQQALRASEIIRRLRTLVRKQPPHKTHACLEQVIHEALHLTKSSSRKLNVPLLLELDDAVPDIAIDTIQIQQVILNIVQNAIDAMQAIPIQRRQVLVRSFVPAEGWVQVAISDTGPGIAEELKARVFEAFVTTKGKHGMGIGLSLCRSIIEAHGGRLWVESEPGQGATFAFTLPV